MNRKLYRFTMCGLLFVATSCDVSHLGKNRYYLTQRAGQTVYLSAIESSTEGNIYAGFPKAAVSKHMHVVNAGFWVPKNDTNLPIRYEFTLNVKNPYPHKIYTKATLANPLDPKRPFLYHHFLGQERSIKVSHAPVEQLLKGEKYDLTFELYKDESRTERIDRIIQIVQSPISIHKHCIEMIKGLKKHFKGNAVCKE